MNKPLHHHELSSSERFLGSIEGVDMYVLDTKPEAVLIARYGSGTFEFYSVYENGITAWLKHAMIKWQGAVALRTIVDILSKEDS